MKWQIFDTGPASAKKNMALDYELLQGLASSQQPILHLYDWEGDCATFGHFLDPYTLLNEEAVKKYNLQLARRPTGGGLVFHLTDFAFSILVPATHHAYSVNTLDNYAFVNRIIVDVIQKFLGTKKSPDLLTVEPKPLDAHSCHFCMAKPTKYDVLWEGRKIGGGAQRRTKHGFLHQGTISIALPPDEYLKNLLKDSSVLATMKKNSYFLLQDCRNKTRLMNARKELRDPKSKKRPHHPFGFLTCSIF